MITRNFFIYMLVGGINTFVGYSLFALFMFSGLHYSLATLAATILGVLFNFKSIGKLVFKSHDNRLIFRFVAVYIVTYTINVLSLKAFKNMQLNLYIAGLAMTIPMALVSYVLHNRFVFRKRENACP